MSLWNLPQELIMEIVSYLDVVEYHSLRLSCRLVYLNNLPVLRRDAFEISLDFLSSISTLRRMDLTAFISLKPSHVSKDLLIYMIEKSYELEPIRILGRNKFSKRFKQEMFLKALDPISTNLVLAMLEDEDIDPTDDDNFAIITACTSGTIEVVQKLLKNEDVELEGCIGPAGENGHAEVIKLLLQDDRIDPTEDDSQALRLASENGHLEVVELLLEDGRADPSDDDNYAICFASLNGHYEIVKLLMKDDRTDPSGDNNYAIRSAASGGHSEIVQLLLTDERVDPITEDNQMLRLALKDEFHEIVRLLVLDDRIVVGKDLIKDVFKLMVDNEYEDAIKGLMKDAGRDEQLDKYINRLIRQSKYKSLVTILKEFPLET
ncbi:ankyrin repeat-containing domain protein [Globomyces pollinis-pini]|nr:ankyrin repeat-containing domain protein [Globomyces pollinis-pini]